MSTFALAAAVFIALAVIAYLFGIAANKADHDVCRKLRELLALRAAGKLNEEEFSQRQAALHAALSNATWQSRKKYIYAIPPVMLGIVAAGIHTGSNPSSQDAPASKAATAIPAPHAASNATDRPGGDLEQMTKRLAERLKQQPGDGPGWALLARSHLEMRQYREAEEAYAQAAKILTPDAAFLAEWANARVSANDGKWDKGALDMISRALAADPNNLKALSLAGKAAYAREDYAQATSYWRRMKAAAKPDTMEAKEADAGITEARARLSGSKNSAAPAQGKK